MKRPFTRLGILGSPDGIYVRELAAAAQRYNSRIEVRMLSFAELAVALVNNAAAVRTLTMRASSNHESKTASDYTANQPRETVADVVGAWPDVSQDTAWHLDALVVRTMPLGSLEQVIFRMDALQLIEQRGVPVVNPPRTLEIAIDKWLTLARLAAAKVATPSTIACQTRHAAMQAFETLGRDVVVKPLFGGEGRGIVRISDPDMAWRVFGTLQQLGNVLYVQQFLPHFGYDIRVLKIGQRWLSVKRRAIEGNWRTNISQGSVAEPHELTDDERLLAEQAANVVGGPLLGIDLLPTQQHGTCVLEVNAVPGWRGTANALGIDVANVIIQHLESLHDQRH